MAGWTLVSNTVNPGLIQSQEYLLSTAGVPPPIKQ